MINSESKRSPAEPVLSRGSTPQHRLGCADTKNSAYQNQINASDDSEICISIRIPSNLSEKGIEGNGDNENHRID
jgi:hypothetical protein